MISEPVVRMQVMAEGKQIKLPSSSALNVDLNAFTFSLCVVAAAVFSQDAGTHGTGNGHYGLELCGARTTSVLMCQYDYSEVA